MKGKFLMIIALLFIVISIIFYVLKQQVPGYQLGVLMAGNIIMAALSAGSYVMVTRQLKNSSAAFVRGVYSSSFLKLMICMIGIVIYVLLNRDHIHKPTVYLLFGLYAIYTVPETMTLSKQARTK